MSLIYGPFQDLDDTISSSRAWSNDFFEHVRNQGLSPEMLRKICPEYYHLTNAFPGILVKLIARTVGGVQYHLVSILYSELGKENELEAHSRLFRTLCEEVGIAGSLDERREFIVASATVAGLERLYGDAPLLQSLGAQYALENQAANMLTSFRRAFRLFESPQGASAGMRFFEVHETDEPDHSAAMHQALARYLKSESEMKTATQGAMACLELLADFWDGLYRIVTIPHLVSPSAERL